MKENITNDMMMVQQYYRQSTTTTTIASCYCYNYHCYYYAEVTCGFLFVLPLLYSFCSPLFTGDELPEWATDDMGGDDEGGTFDASGAFLSLKEFEKSSEDKMHKRPEDQSKEKTKPPGENVGQ